MSWPLSKRLGRRAHALLADHIAPSRSELAWRLAARFADLSAVASNWAEGVQNNAHLSSRKVAVKSSPI